MDKYPLQHDRNILHPSKDVNYSVIMKTMSVIAMQTYQFQFAIQTYSDKTDSGFSE